MKEAVPSVLTQHKAARGISIMDNRTVIVHVRMSEDEFCASQQFYIKSFRRSSAVVPPMFILLLMLLASDFSTFHIVFSLVLAACTFLSILLLRKIKKKALRTQYRNNKMLQQEKTYVIKADGLECYSENVDSRYTWKDLYGLEESEDAFYIFLAQKQFMYLPKNRIGENDADYQFVKNCLSQLPPYRAKKPLTFSTILLAVMACLFLILVVCILIFRLL